MSLGLIFGIVIVWVIPAILGFQIGSAKERDSGLALGLLLSWVGVVTLLLLPAGGQSCPFCAEKVRTSATACRHCGRALGAHLAH